MVEDTIPPPSVERAALLKLEECERRAWQALAGYKFSTFGVWAAQWVLTNAFVPGRRRNPFAEAVNLARAVCEKKGWRAHD